MCVRVGLVFFCCEDDGAAVVFEERKFRGDGVGGVENFLRCFRREEVEEMRREVDVGGGVDVVSLEEVLEVVG